MPTATQSQISFQLAGGRQPLIVLPVFVCGRGPYSFILDTGAGPTLVSHELAEDLGLPRGEVETGHGAGGEIQLVQSALRSLRVGEEVLEEVSVYVTDLNFIERAIGAQVNGNLGHSVLRHFILTLDYAANVLTLERPSGEAHKGSALAGERTLAFRLAHPSSPLVVIPTFVNGQGPFDFALDTGASSSILSLELARSLGLAMERISDLTAGGGKVGACRAHLESLCVGAARQEGVSAAVSDFLAPLTEVLGVKLYGIVGYNFLRHFRVTLDYPSQLLGLDGRP